MFCYVTSLLLQVNLWQIVSQLSLLRRISKFYANQKFNLVEHMLICTHRNITPTRSLSQITRSDVLEGSYRPATCVPH